MKQFWSLWSTIEDQIVSGSDRRCWISSKEAKNMRFWCRDDQSQKTVVTTFIKRGQNFWCLWWSAEPKDGKLKLKWWSAQLNPITVTIFKAFPYFGEEESKQSMWSLNLILLFYIFQRKSPFQCFDCMFWCVWLCALLFTFSSRHLGEEGGNTSDAWKCTFTLFRLANISPIL